MNMLNALNAYGVQQKESAAKPLSNPDAAAKSAKTSFAEAIQYTDETEVKQKQTSDIYSKNGMGEEQEAKAAARPAIVIILLKAFIFVYLISIPIIGKYT